MTTSNLQPLMVLLAQAERQRDLAITEHQRTKAAFEAASEQSRQLLTYRREYEQRWSAQFSRDGKMELVHCYHSFMERLSQAVDQQGRVAEYAQQNTGRAQDQLREIELRCASVRKLIERRTQGIRQSAEKRDQKQTDEQASRTAWMQRSASGHV